MFQYMTSKVENKGFIKPQAINLKPFMTGTRLSLKEEENKHQSFLLV